MNKLLVITPVKNSIDLTEKTIRAVMDGMDKQQMKYVVYDDVAYIKGGWINRNNILMNGSKNLLTVPLKDASSFKNINEIDKIKKSAY